MNREHVKISQNIAAAVAQEMRNPVFGIASAAQLLRYRVSDDPVMERNIGRILRDTERLNVLITALLDYGRPAPVRLEPLDPDGIWIDVVARHRGLLESKAILVQHSPCTPRATCAVDAEQFAQACSNTLVNAIDAAPEGSDLAITSTLDSDGAWHSRLHNDGPAIDNDFVSHVFDPLVTTKPGHAGLGLAAAHRILVDHGGSISMESADGSGTTVTLILPALRFP